MDPAWLRWVKRLQAIAQNGLTYARDPYDVERYEHVRAVAGEMIAAYSDAEPERVPELLTREAGDATPKVDVRGVVFRDERILLVRERRDGRWTLPGGWGDVGESPAESTVRETYEESGYRTRAVKLLALYDRDHERHGHPPMPYHVYKIFFLCELVDDAREEHGAAGAAFVETDEVGFFPESELPPLSLTRVTPAQIARFFAHRRHPDWPADFD